MDTPKKIELIVRALVNKGERVLLCRSLKGGHCYLPGGHLEPGESARDALRREMLEEAGESMLVGDLVLVHEHRFQQQGRARHEVNLVFHVELDGSCRDVTSREADIAFEWVAVAALERSQFVPADLIPAVAELVAGTQGRVSSGGLQPPTASFLADEAG